MHLLALSSIALALVGNSLAITPLCNNINLIWNGSQCVPSCPKLNAAVTSQTQQSTASAFCSSYLNIPVVTSTVTSTSTILTTSTSTYTSGTFTTTDSTITVGAVATRTVSTTLTVTNRPTTTLTQTACLTTSYISSCAPTATAASRRRRGIPAIAAPNVHKPVILAPFNAGPALSSACACLSVTPSTTFVTASTSSTLTIPASTTVPSTLHATSTLTSTNTITQTTTFTNTVTSSQTVLLTTTSSVNGLAFPTFAIRVQGGDNTGHYITNSGTYMINNQASSPAAGLAFNLDTGCNLYLASGPNTGDEIVQDASQSTDPRLFINTPGSISAINLRYFTCSVQKASDGTCPMTCTSALNTGSTIWDCGVYWRIGTVAQYQASGCYGWTPLVVGSV
jgi:hypothetical protein